jgi:hypothetical protein
MPKRRGVGISWASVSPSQKVVWHPLEAIWCHLGVCSRLLGAMAGKADAIPSRGRRETCGIPTTTNGDVRHGVRADLEGRGGTGWRTDSVLWQREAPVGGEREREGGREREGWREGGGERERERELGWKGTWLCWAGMGLLGERASLGGRSAPRLALSP